MPVRLRTWRAGECSIRARGVRTRVSFSMLSPRSFCGNLFQDVAVPGDLINQASRMKERLGRPARPRQPGARRLPCLPPAASGATGDGPPRRQRAVVQSGLERALVQRDLLSLRHLPKPLPFALSLANLPLFSIRIQPRELDIKRWSWGTEVMQIDPSLNQNYLFFFSLSLSLSLSVSPSS